VTTSIKNVDKFDRDMFRTSLVELTKRAEDFVDRFIDEKAYCHGIMSDGEAISIYYTNQWSEDCEETIPLSVFFSNEEDIAAYYKKQSDEKEAAEKAKKEEDAAFLARITIEKAKATLAEAGYTVAKVEPHDSRLD